MSDKVNTNSVPFVPKSKQDPEGTGNSDSKKQRPKKQQPGSHHQHRRTKNNNNNISNSKYKRESRSNNSELDFEWSIQEELASGNYKLNGRKTKISINHLLDFQLPEIDRKQNSYRTTFEKNRRRRSEQDRVYLHGDSFINANYKFLVDENGDYSAQSSDPNVVLPPSLIRRVIIPRGQSCPICLTEELVSPRMAICGHVFCQTCLIRLFENNSEVKKDAPSYLKKRKDLKECPLCTSIIKKTSTIPVLIEETGTRPNPLKLGSTVDLKLMCKPHGSLLPLPSSLNVDPLGVGNFPSLHSTDLLPYCRIFKVDNDYAIDLFVKDNAEITRQQEIDKAIYNENEVLSNLAIDENLSMIAKLREQRKSESPNLSNLSIVDGIKKYNDSNAYYFYETAFGSGVKYFLSPLDIKILKSAFHNYCNFPPTLSAKIEDIHYGSMVTENTISKCRYISHLPIGTELAFIDVDWRNSPIIPKTIHDHFADELRQRRRKSAQKRNREDKEKKLYEQRLEQEHQDFYQKENGNILLGSTPNIVSQFPPASSKNLVLQHASKPDIPKNNSDRHKERTVWGTEIMVTDPKNVQDDENFEQMLLQASHASGESKNGRKNKKKILLMGNSSMRSL